MPRKAEPDPPVITLGLILLALAGAAYGSAALHYIPAADDIVLVDSLTNSGNAFHFHRQGLWRILGIAIMSTGLNMPHPVYVGLVVMLHAFNSYLSYRILRLLAVPVFLALGAAALFAVSPGFHEAIVWIAGSSVVWSCSCFLLTFRLALDHSLTESRPRFTGLLCLGLALAGNLCNEQLLFAYFALLPAVVWLRGEGWWPRLSRRLGVLAMPALGSLLFVAGYLATLGPETTKQPAFSLRAAFSPWYYQYANLMVFDVWRHPLWVKLFGREISSLPGLAFSLCLVLGILGLARLQLGRDEQSPSGLMPAPRRQSIAGWILLWLGTSGIFALAGGYSLDSRKRYVFVLLLVLGVVHLLSPLKFGRWYRPGLCALCVFFAGTTMALTRARREMLTAKNGFCLALDQGSIRAPVWIEGWEDPPTSLYRYLWTDVREEMNYHHAPGSSTLSLAPSREKARSIIHYDWMNQQWLQSAPPP